MSLENFVNALVDRGYEITLTKPVGDNFQWECCVDSHCIRSDNPTTGLHKAWDKARGLEGFEREE